jgi:hypothetical protein
MDVVDDKGILMVGHIENGMPRSSIVVNDGNPYRILVAYSGGSERNVRYEVTNLNTNVSTKENLVATSNQNTTKTNLFLGTTDLNLQYFDGELGVVKISTC